MLGDKIKVLVFMKSYEDIRLFLENNFECRIFEGDWGDEFPKEIHTNTKSIMINKETIDPHFGIPYTISEGFEVDWIISWLCPWKIPEPILKCAKNGAINFHPGPPEYPGIGCYNYAIWNQDKEYGIIAHYMDGELDHGKILRQHYVDIYENDTVETLKNRAIVKLKDLFYYVMNKIIKKEKLKLGFFEWGVYKSRKDFQKFCNLTYIIDKMDRIVLEKKMRATYFKGANDGPYIEINNKKWRLIPEEDL